MSATPGSPAPETLVKAIKNQGDREPIEADLKTVKQVWPSRGAGSGARLNNGSRGPECILAPAD
jgi:hypothetical protein